MMLCLLNPRCWRGRRCSHLGTKMRRSSAPSQRGRVVPAMPASTEAGTAKTLAETVMYNRNAASVSMELLQHARMRLQPVDETFSMCSPFHQVAAGKCVVSREPLTNWLIVPPGRPVSTKFISPCTTRSEEAERLRKVKSLGVRGR